MGFGSYLSREDVPTRHETNHEHRNLDPLVRAPILAAFKYGAESSGKFLPGLVAGKRTHVGSRAGEPAAKS